MKFCNNCDNMFYISLQDDECNKIIYYCKNCGNSDNNLLETNKCILKEHISKNESKFEYCVNDYTKLDITLPRINYIKCPNEKCKSNEATFDSNLREILYIRYDDVNMKYLYLCSHCDFKWNTDK